MVLWVLFDIWFDFNMKVDDYSGECVRPHKLYLNKKLNLISATHVTTVGK